MNSFIGVRIAGGIQPFQIVQQDEEEFGQITCHGQWHYEEGPGVVQLRIVHASDGRVVGHSTDWQQASEQKDADWSHTFSQIPAGGLYRLESRLVIDQGAPEWGIHGDHIHHIGVGDLWIIAGQSNAAGYGRGPAHDPPELGIHILKNEEVWDVAAHPLNDTTRSTHPNLENANPGHAPYLQFAKDLKAELGYPIGLIQTALGGSPLSAWNPGENPEAPLFNNLIHCLTLAGGKARGMVWYQGESDCSIALAPSYETRFASFITHLRKEMGQPDFPVIIAQLNRYVEPQDDEGHRGWSIVREAQRQAKTLGHVTAVSTIDLPISDAIHTSSGGNLTLGSRKARAAQGMVYGYPVHWRPMDVSSARLLEDTVVELIYGDVENRLLFLGPGHEDFIVQDDIGQIKITSASCVSRDRVHLVLERPIQGRGRVHGAYGSAPPSTLRDAETNVPPLGFFDLTIETT
jgi:sialate O-acetylesterase